MRYLHHTILLTASPENMSSCIAALEYCNNLISNKATKINCLFLQNEAVHLGIANPIILDDEPNIVSQWQSFIEENKIPSFICTNSALRRNIVDQHFAEYYQRSQNLAKMFRLDTLGKLFTSIENSDRFIQL